MPGTLDRRILVTATVCALAAVAVVVLLMRPRPPEAAPAAQDASAACAEVARHWPATVAAVERRDDLAGGGRATAAWGDPAIIARCGVPAPPPSTDQCVDVDGVDWLVKPLSDGTRLTTYGRSPALEVLVPKRYDPAPMRIGDLGDAARRLPSTGHRCR